MEYSKISIKELPHQERPREKLQLLGSFALSNAELMAVLLRTGSEKESAVHLAERLLSRSGGLSNLPVFTLEELQDFKGIGLAKAVQVKAALELGRRLATSWGEQRVAVTSPAHVADLFMEELRYKKKEFFMILLLDTKNRVISREQVSVGSLNASIVHPREIFHLPVKKSASSVILVHNHPSGDPTPSREDKEVSGRLVDAGKILGIEVKDHIIIGDGIYLSFKEKGFL